MKSDMKQRVFEELRQHRGKYWWAQYSSGAHSRQIILSTEEAIELLKKGYMVDVIGGPHATREEAHYRADVAWDEPE